MLVVLKIPSEEVVSSSLTDFKLKVQEVLYMPEGTVKFFNNMKHFGFISGDDGKDYFVHSSGIKEGTSIKEGDRVSFKTVKGDRGLKAEEVEKME